MKKYLLGLAAVLALASPAYADVAEDMGYASTGTAFKFVSGTTVTVSGSSTVSSFTSSTIPAIVYRFACDGDVYANFRQSGVASPVATSSSMPIYAKTPEYFIIGKSTNTALIASGTDNVRCHIGKTGR